MDERVKKVLDHIEGNLTRQLTLKQLSAIACLSSSQFHRIFKKETQRTPFKFIEELKMNKAYQLIMQGDKLVNELAEQFGYNDYETFSRTFKKYFHFSPDDLKSIIGSLKEQMEGEAIEEVLIAISKDASKEELDAQLQKMIVEKGLAINDLQEAKIFTIVNKSGAWFKPQKLIKNKFSLTSESKIWESILKNKSTTKK